MPMEVRKVKGPRPPREPDRAEMPVDGDQWRPPAAFPTPPNADGVVYHWVRKSVKGEIDQNNMSQRFREGWTPVLATEFPELQLTAGGDAQSDFIEVSGLILCRCSEEKMRQRKRYYEQLTERQMTTVDRSMFRFEDKRMPMFSERSSSVTLGRKPEGQA